MPRPATTLEGTWEMVRAELEGEAAPELVTSKTVLELTAGAYVVRYAGETMDRGEFALAQAGRHAALILTGRSGSNAGRAIPCIYQIAGDRLRVCYGLDGIAPDDFAAAKGSRRYLATYRRQLRREAHD